MNKDNQIEQKLAGSLTANTVEIIPFLPYLLQDIYELGSNPSSMITLIKNNIEDYPNKKVIDLGCGKGAVSISLAKELKMQVKGIDLLPAFIEEANSKANEYDVTYLCDFVVEDINQSIDSTTKYDLVILGAVGDVLGTPRETLNKLKQVVDNKGYLLIDEAYLIGQQNDVKYQNYEYLTLTQWKQLFKELHLELVADLISDDSEQHINDYNNKMISQRANELSMKYPDKKKLFDDYVESQENECDDLDNTIVGVTWLLKCL